MSQTNTTSDFLLGVARDAIQIRAARDDYNPDEYDAERDPDGYITSLLTALHHWCHRHAIDWDIELARAQGCFEQDLAEAGCQTEAPLLQPCIEDLACPKCHQDASFVIEVTERLLMFKDGIELHGDIGEEWDDSSYCRCPACEHIATVYQFRKSHQQKEMSSNE